MNQIQGLNGLRCLAAFAVITTHLGLYHVFAAAGLANVHVLVGGTTGVNLFYVISGFLITTLAIREMRRAGTFSIKGFFARRALRIFPLYYFALLVYLLAHFAGIAELRPSSFLFALTYTYNFIPARLYQGWLGGFHTLATEEHFYLLFPFLFLALYRRSALLFGAIIVAYVILVPLTKPWFDDVAQYFVEGVSRWSFYACVPIFIGCLLAGIRESDIFGRIRSNLSIMPRLAEAAILIVFLVCYFSQVVRPNDMVMAISFAFLILYISEFQSSIPTRLMSIRPIDYLGRISYGLYVWQSFILSTGPAEALIKSVPGAIATVIILAIASYEFFEKHILALKGRLHPRAPRATDGSSLSLEPLPAGDPGQLGGQRVQPVN